MHQQINWAVFYTVPAALQLTVVINLFVSTIVLTFFFFFDRDLSIIAFVICINGKDHVSVIV